MNFLDLMQRFTPLLEKLAHRPGDESQEVTQEVIDQLESALTVLQQTSLQVEQIRSQRVDTSRMSIAEIDNLIRGH